MKLIRHCIIPSIASSCVTQHISMTEATMGLRMNRGLKSQRGATRSVCLLIFGCLVVFLPVDSFVLSGSKQQNTAVFSVGKGKSRNKKWDDRGGKKPFKTRRPEPSGPRPVLTDYIENRNHYTSLQILTNQNKSQQHTINLNN